MAKVAGSEEWNEGRLLETSGGYWQAFALHTGVTLDLFTALGKERLKEKEIAQKLNLDKRGVFVLLNALVAMGLLQKVEDRYANTPASEALLSKESDRYIGYMILHHHHLVNSWHRLDQAVKSGRPVQRASAPKAQERESFLMGMFNLAMGIAPRLAHQLKLPGRKHLLDLGGGPGTYAIHFCLANAGLRATLYDLPTTRPFAARTIERFALSDRIDFMEGDYLLDRIGGRYDVAWLSHILHGEGPEECQLILDKTASTLVPGGMILIHDFLLNESLDGPLFPALFSLNMLVNTEKGRSYSESQVRNMMEVAGFHDLRRVPFEGPNGSGILTGII
jgi:hypothetical protein